MCRLLGILGGEVLPREWLDAFADLAVTGNAPGGAPDPLGHADGWGLVLFRNGVLLESVHEAGSAARDPEYARVARKIAGASAAVAPGNACVVLGHIRRASPGMPVGREWSHPFVDIRDGQAWAFAHNGGLEGYAFTEEERLIDSQVVFRRLLSNLDGPSGAEVADATRRTEAQIREEFPGYTALNFLLTDGARLHAFRQCLRDESYYTLYHGRVGRSVLVCSQPIGSTDATALENGTLATAGANLAVAVTRVV